jgi:hypothetical protein
MKRPEFALSVRQPFAEAILTGRKAVEYRSTATKRLNKRSLFMPARVRGAAGSSFG